MTNKADAPWDRVRKALSSEPLRTIEGISDETGLPPDEIQRLLSAHASEVRASWVTDRGGRKQYTLKDRPLSMLELWATIRDIGAKSG